MAFRRFGGLNYAPNNNIVHNTYSNTKNLTITNQVGAPNSNVLIQSNLDMSSNSLFGIGEAHFETGFITSDSGTLTFDNSTSISSGIDFNTGSGITLRGMNFNNAEGTTFRFNTTGGGAISLHNQTVSVSAGDINIAAPTGQTIFIDPLLTVPKITTRPDTDLFVSTGSSDGHIRIDRDVDIISDIIQIGDSLFQGNVGITGTLGVTGASVFNGQVGITGRLGVTGRSVFDGSVGITGLFGVTGRSVFNGQVGITGLFGVTGASTFDGSVGITGLFGVTGTSTFDGAVGITGLFGVTGASTFDGSVGVTGLFGVTGSSVFNGQVGITGQFGVTGTSTFDGSVGITGLFGVTGASTFDGSVGITGLFGVTGRSVFDGAIGITGLFGVTGASVFDGAVGITGLFGVTGSSVFNGQVGITGLFGVTGMSVFDGSLGITGLFGVTGMSVFDGSVGITGLFGVTGMSTFDGRVGITGLFGVTGMSVFDGSVGITGLFGVTGMSVFDGSVGVTGLFGVTGMSVFDGSLGITGLFGVTGASTFDGSVVFNGSVDFNTSIGFNGSIGVSGAFGVTGTSTFDGSVGITGLFGVTGASVFNGTVEFVDYVPTCKIGPTGDYDLTNKSYVLSVVSAGGVILFNQNNIWTGTNTFNNSVAVNGPFDVTGASVFNGNVNVKNVLTLDSSLALTSYPSSTLSQFDLSCLKGTTGGVIQNQLDGKVNLTGAETIAGAKTFSSDLTLGNGSNLVLTNPATTLSQTELSYLDNATSNIQTQITARVSKTGAVDESIDGVKTFSNNLTLGNGSNLVLTNPATTLSQTELARLDGLTSDIVTVGATQSISGAKTFSNLKLNGDLALTLPDISLTQTELARLDGLTSDIVTVGATQSISGAKTFSGTTTFNNGSATNFNGTTTFNSNLTLDSGLVLSSFTPDITLTQNVLSYLDGATSNIQTQLGGKVNNTGDEDINGVKTFTNNLKLGSSSSLVLTSQSTTLLQTELSYLSGATSKIQTQLNGKVNNTGDEIISGAKTFNNNLRLGAGTNLTLIDKSSNNVSQDNLNYLKDVNAAIVTIGTSGGANQTIVGPKTFSGTTTFNNGSATNFDSGSTTNFDSGSATNFNGTTTFNSNLTLGALSKLMLNSGTDIDQTELGYLNGVSSEIVTVGAAQTISGAKTFSGNAIFTASGVIICHCPAVFQSGSIQSFQSGSITSFASGSTTTFSGTTKFDSNLTLGASSKLMLNSGTDIDQTELGYLNGVSSEIVTVGAAQSISGAKTFSGTTTFNNVSTTNFASDSATTFNGTTTFNSNLTLGASSKLMLNSGTDIDQTELGYLNGVSSEIVTVGAAQSISGAKTFSGTTTFSSNLILGTGSKLIVNTSTEIDQNELACLDGATSNIQTQINERVTLATSQSISGVKTFSNNTTFGGTVTFPNSTSINNGAVTAISFDATSDYRIKQNVTNLGNTYTLDNLRPVSYYNTKLQSQDLGFIAHEVQQEIPHIVTGEKDGEKLQSINYNRLIPILVKELNEQKQENKQNKELINKLMQSNEYLMKHVNELIKKLL
jgi:hypothetical protein